MTLLEDHAAGRCRIGPSVHRIADITTASTELDHHQTIGDRQAVDVFDYNRVNANLLVAGIDTKAHPSTPLSKEVMDMQRAVRSTTTSETDVDYVRYSKDFGIVRRTEQHA